MNRYIITIEPLPARADEAAANIRIRQLLRIADKAMRLRCVSVRRIETEPTDSQGIDTGALESK